MKHVVTLIVNGEAHETLVRSADTLLEVLRDKLRLTGTKEGCETGKCGACTILVNGSAIRSCLTLAVAMNGKRITTIEGLTDGDRLHPLQQSFIDHGAVQCGFCSPGMIMAAKAYLDENPTPSESELKEAMASNICRCTGYESIYEAIMAVTKTGKATIEERQE